MLADQKPMFDTKLQDYSGSAAAANPPTTTAGSG